MSRGVLAVDRLVAVLLGLLLVAGGVAGLAWWTGDLAPGTSLDTAPVADVTGAGWFPAACGGLAVVLALLGLWWLLAHVPRRGAGQVALPGSGPRGALRVEGDAPAKAAAQVLGAVPGVRSAGGRLVQDRGRLVAELSATLEPRADLAEVAAAAGEVRGQLLEVLSRPDVVGRVRLGVARADRGSRVS
ncbi:hypothetical protein [Kineococcus radiotolerans]|uniref:Alkaline shock response membrane anchor protein AmaP n=1 Tax=Kineococcus radiotolerans (strain ATCC BAA-149 / DSM 14245 / SRS30216) TaxID=266940 RepID=A6WGJ5_KINRD|nr:hypothetical protein [Kineococcus radiotolerans]ABS05934.1 conserved hypothetical protein [Kineococcus radiotolerans SRS30216 = ATCC BAA-149]